MLIQEVYQAQKHGSIDFKFESRCGHIREFQGLEDFDMVILPTEREKARLKRIAKVFHPDCKINFVCWRIYATRKPQANGGKPENGGRGRRK